VSSAILSNKSDEDKDLLELALTEEEEKLRTIVAARKFELTAGGQVSEPWSISNRTDVPDLERQHAGQVQRWHIEH
jgi:hypothetical protein